MQFSFDLYYISSQFSALYKTRIKENAVEASEHYGASCSIFTASTVAHFVEIVHTRQDGRIYSDSFLICLNVQTTKQVAVSYHRI